MVFFVKKVIKTRKRKRKRKIEFSKKMLFGDYAILLVMMIVSIIFVITGKGTESLAIVISAWIGQLAISSGFYYWKTKSENLIKMPILLLDELPADMREKADPNQIIESAIGMKD